ncbi:MAG: prepilin-type N-terminal cleavage/methylation domain-containing protein [Okeania sp. SIO3C4]|nr:prepilin-type N-terminal cleavage/methylation domain-containing protein [Okeania sp. SIO3C4]
MSRAARTRAFTLIELLVVVAVIGILISVLVPALASARASAQLQVCKSNIRQLSVAMLSRASDFDGELSTGLWSNDSRKSYGPLDTHGWVADLVNADYGKPGEMLCPTHPATTTQDLLDDRIDDSPWKQITPQERDELVQRGMNTNYTLSWYVAYTDMRDRFDPYLDPKRTNDVIGPLHEKRLGKAPAYAVPLIGTGRTDTDNAGTINGEFQEVVKGLTDGPTEGWNADAGRYAKQDYSDWGPAHGGGGAIFSSNKNHDRKTGNIGFADGHVASFDDTFNVDQPDQPGRDGEFAPVLESTPYGQRWVYKDDNMQEKVFGGSVMTGEWFNK